MRYAKGFVFSAFLVATWLHEGKSASAWPPAYPHCIPASYECINQQMSFSYYCFWDSNDAPNTTCQDMYAMAEGMCAGTLSGFSCDYAGGGTEGNLYCVEQGTAPC